jgi:O-antigen/teichoic acid export membrane protein
MITTGDKIFSNTFFNLIARTLASASRLVVSIAIARLLGPSLNGTYSLVTFTLTIVGVFTSMGLESLSTKYISEFSALNDNHAMERIFSYTVKAKFLITVGAILVLMAMSGHIEKFYSQPNLALYIIVSAVALVPDGIAVILFSAIQGMQNYKVVAIKASIVAPLQIALMVMALMLGYGILGLVAANLVISTTDACISYYFVRRKIKFRVRFKDSMQDALWGRIFRYNWQVAIIIFLDSIVWQRSEVFFLGKLASQAETGFYSLAYNLASMTLGFLPGAFISVLFPAISELHGSNNKDEIRRIFLNATRFVMIFCIPVCLIGIAVSKPLVRLLYGEAYLPVAPVLNLLMLSTCVGLICSPASSAIYGTEKQGIILKVGLVTSALNICLDLALIPSFGAVGAALANACAQVVAVVISTHLFCTWLEISFPFRDLAKIAAISGIVFVWSFGVVWFQGGAIGLVLSLATSCAVYCFLVFKLRIFRDADILIFQHFGDRLPKGLQMKYLSLLRYLEQSITQGCTLRR